MDKVDYIFTYVMDDIEFAEADSVANTVNSHGGLKLEIGNPHFASDICGSVKVIERDLEYYYYFLFDLLRPKTTMATPNVLLWSNNIHQF